MRWKNVAVAAFAAATAVLYSADASAQRVLTREPPMGALKPGQVVFVDDGSCGAGRILRVTGGDHRKVGGRGNVERQRRCVPKRR
jgi:hypothetical protein